eukprot:gene12229-16381_t
MENMNDNDARFFTPEKTSNQAHGVFTPSTDETVISNLSIDLASLSNCSSPYTSCSAAPIHTSGSSNSLSQSSTTRKFSNRFGVLYASHAIGSLWTVEMTCLKQSGSYFEAAECLKRIRELLDEIDRSDRLKFCKADYDAAVKLLKKQKTFWSNDLFCEVVAITIKYFHNCPIMKLPTDVMQNILLYIPIDCFGPITSVCKEWHSIGTSDQIWRMFYYQKFIENNPGSMPLTHIPTYISAFKTRLNDPQIGDKVEVAWRGKFRLETQEVYQGLAWWVAEIVDKHHSQGRYKIRYPGWDSRWDEWVPRSRLRWAVSRNTLVSIEVNDIVELWCCGANVPGAWLESKVKKIRNGRYCIGKVLSSGYLWVERDRIRLVRRGTADLLTNSTLRNDNTNNNLLSDMHGLSSRRGLMSSLSSRFSSITQSNRTASCTIS